MKKPAQKPSEKSFSGVLPFIIKWQTPLLTAVLVIALSTTALVIKQQEKNQSQDSLASDLPAINAENVSLPSPDYRSANSIEAVLKNRRTRLNFTDSSLSLKQIGQVLYAAQGVNTDWGDRTAPSSKSTYPLSVFLLANKVDGLDQGEYQYIAGDRLPVHQLKPIKKVDLSQALFELLNQSSFNGIPAVIVITGDLAKMAEAYGGIPHDKEVYLEAGYAAQNIALEAESLKLGTNVSTNFDELKLRELITVSTSDTIILLMPIGIPK